MAEFKCPCGNELPTGELMAGDFWKCTKCGRHHKLTENDLLQDTRVLIKPLKECAEAEIRTFNTGATRNNDPDRIDWIRMLSLPALFEYGAYMARHRKQADGNLRAFDNWKGEDGRGGFPLNEVVESLTRHVFDLAALHSGLTPVRECDVNDTCCAIIFNSIAYLHTILSRESPKP